MKDFSPVVFPEMLYDLISWPPPPLAEPLLGGVSNVIFGTPPMNMLLEIVDVPHPFLPSNFLNALSVFASVFFVPCLGGGSPWPPTGFVSPARKQGPPEPPAGRTQR